MPANKKKKCVYVFYMYIIVHILRIVHVNIHEFVTSLILRARRMDPRLAGFAEPINLHFQEPGLSE